VDATELRSRVEELEWFHSIDLGHGIKTPGTDDSAKKLARLGLPADLTGKRVLDIGAYDGFFSFAAERAGAAQVADAGFPHGRCQRKFGPGRCGRIP